MDKSRSVEEYKEILDLPYEKWLEKPRRYNAAMYWTCWNGSSMIVYRIVMKNKSSEWLDYIELWFDSISLKCVKHMKTFYQDENNVVLVENSVEWKPCINRECKSLKLTI